MVYLDSAATTEVSEKAKEALLSSLDHFGNPSSVHSLGIFAKKELESSRKAVAQAIGIRPSDKGKLLFTSCGSEGNNLAIIGTALSKKRFAGGKIIITDSEHPSVNKSCEFLENIGFSVVKIPTKGGEVDKDRFLSELDNSTVLVSMMSVNNETGAIYDIPSLFSKARELNKEVTLHTDAVQAFGKIEISPNISHADIITVSGHKVHAPKGIGALYISERIITEKRIVPQIYGGGQEFSIRSGTESTHLAAAFAAAVTEKENRDKVLRLRELLINNLDKRIKSNMPPAYQPGIVSLTLPGIKSETMVVYLSGRGFCVSAGSACSSHGGHDSYVLRAFGLSEDDADSTIRVSFGDEITKENILDFTAALSEGINSLAAKNIGG